MSRLISFSVLVAILIVIGVLFYQVIASFILPLFLAILLVVIFRPLYLWILQRTRQHAYLASLLTTAAVLGIVLVPFISICVFAVVEASSVVTKINVATMRDRLAESRESLGLDIPHADRWRQIESKLNQALSVAGDSGDTPAQPVPATIASDFDGLVDAYAKDHAPLPEHAARLVREALTAIQTHMIGTIEYDAAVQDAIEQLRAFKQQQVGSPMWLKELANPSEDQLRRTLLKSLSAAQQYLLSAVGNTTGFIAKTIFGLVIMVVAMFFFFADGPKMMESVMQLTPLDRNYERELLTEFDRISRAVVVATLLSAAVQGLLAGVGYAVAGMDSVFLLMLLTTVFAMIPFFGAAAVWVPVCLWLYFYEGQTTAAIMLAIYGAGVVSTIDNVIKPWVLHGHSKLHPLAALLSVLGGVQALGPIGILVGPMVFVFLATLLKLVQRELLRFDKLPWAGGAEAVSLKPPTEGG